MIKSFRSRSLKRYWAKDDASGIRPDWIPRINLILDALHAAVEPEELDIPGLNFHPLKGDRMGEYAVSILRNWRVTFGWSGQDAIDVNMEDYHGD
jgi:proteic killer suppression protein